MMTLKPGLADKVCCLYLLILLKSCYRVCYGVSASVLQTQPSAALLSKFSCLKMSRIVSPSRLSWSTWRRWWVMSILTCTNCVCVLSGFVTEAAGARVRSESFPEASRRAPDSLNITPHVTSDLCQIKPQHSHVSAFILILQSPSDLMTSGGPTLEGTDDQRTKMSQISSWFPCTYDQEIHSLV